MASSLERRSNDAGEEDAGSKTAKPVECDENNDHQLVTSDDVLIYGFYDAEENGDHRQMSGSEVEEEGKSNREDDANDCSVEDMDGEHPLSSTLPSTSVLTY